MGYIIRADISPMVGWETGRASEPAFMDMNLHAVRDESLPKVVLYQQDKVDPMNPLGLLVAYQEKEVKPVVSDFDTLLTGSRGMKYERLPEEQAEMVSWALNHAHDILRSGRSPKAWTSRWLEILKKEAERGFHPNVPKFGFGDPTSVAVISDVVNVTLPCGAVRHGAECFNFYFPQELDDEFLVIWEGLPDMPWAYKTEPELREFLIERANEGYSFPLNPLWPVRDQGWYEVLEALMGNEVGKIPLASWYPESQGIMQKIQSIHAEFPQGFARAPPPTNEAPAENDLVGCEVAELAEAELIMSIAKKRWRRGIGAALLATSGIGGLGKKNSTAS